MTIVLLVRYRGPKDAARSFAEEVTSAGILDRVRAEDGNIEYCYYLSMSDPDEVLLVERWRDITALDSHKAAEPIALIGEIKTRHGLETTVMEIDKRDRFAETGG